MVAKAWLLRVVVVGVPFAMRLQCDRISRAAPATGWDGPRRWRAHGSGVGCWVLGAGCFDVVNCCVACLGPRGSHKGIVGLDGD